MEKDYEINRNQTEIQSKVDKINDLKGRFYQTIKKKIGELLVEEINKKIEEELRSDAGKITLKIPYFLKPIFSFYNNDALIIETSLYYIIYSLDLMDPEMKIVYEQNLAQFEASRTRLTELKGLLQIYLNNMPAFDILYKIPSQVLPIYPILEEEINNLIIFGMLKLFEWLNILDLEIYPEKPTYEHSYTKILKALS